MLAQILILIILINTTDTDNTNTFSIPNLDQPWSTHRVLSNSVEELKLKASEVLRGSPSTSPLWFELHWSHTDAA